MISFGADPRWTKRKADTKLRHIGDTDEFVLWLSTYLNSKLIGYNKRIRNFAAGWFSNLVQSSPPFNEKQEFFAKLQKK